MEPIRLLVADDHEIVRKGIRSLLEAQPGWQVTAEASDGREAVVVVAGVLQAVVVRADALARRREHPRRRLVEEAHGHVRVGVLAARVVEHEADDALRFSLGKLFREEPNAKEIIKWKEIYEIMETATDRCSDVTDIIQSILLENN